MAYKDLYQMSDSQVGPPPAPPLLSKAPIQGASGGLGVRGIESDHASQCPPGCVPLKAHGEVGAVLHAENKAGIREPWRGDGGVVLTLRRSVAAPSPAGGGPGGGTAVWANPVMPGGCVPPECYRHGRACPRPAVVCNVGCDMGCNFAKRHTPAEVCWLQDVAG